MPMTPYSSANHEFSNKAHKQAQIDIYPLLFGVPAERLSFPVLKDAKERAEAQKRDYNDAIDREPKIFVPGLDGPLSITVQERFRKPEFAHHQDATITGFNNKSGLLSELYKIQAELMVYAYFNDVISRFIEAIGFWVAPLKYHIIQSNIQLRTKPNNRSDQSFFYFKFDELEALPGVVVFRKKWGDGTPGQGMLHRPLAYNNTYTKNVTQTLEQAIQTSMWDYGLRNHDPEYWHKVRMQEEGELA